LLYELNVCPALQNKTKSAEPHERERASTMRKLFLLSIFILIMGCATLPPLMQDIESQQIAKANYKRVWLPVNKFFNERDIPIKSISMEAGSLETEAIKIPYEGFAYGSDYCDCGTLGGDVCLS
jgi:hypothetical protein